MDITFDSLLICDMEFLFRQLFLHDLLTVSGYTATEFINRKFSLHYPTVYLLVRKTALDPIYTVKFVQISIKLYYTNRRFKALGSHKCFSNFVLT